MKTFNSFKLIPTFKDYLWGGTKLKTDFKMKSDLQKIAESWELSTHKDGKCTIMSGEYKDKLLDEVIDIDKENILGKKALKFDFFPVLIKLIDAYDNLSVQVHPDDAYALKNEGEYGKTEMWYIVDCEKDAFLYYGFNRKITKDEFKKRIDENTLLEVLNKVPVKKGDVFFIQSGTVHAIGKGILICEVQQNSNTTYRVYDYNRKDKNGKTRPLHIEKAIEVSNLDIPINYKIEDSIYKNGCTSTILSKCKYFSVEKIEVLEKAEIDITNDSFHSLIILEGNGEFKSDNDTIEFKKGDSIFIPANHNKFFIEGSCLAIMTYIS